MLHTIEIKQIIFIIFLFHFSGLSLAQYDIKNSSRHGESKNVICVGVDNEIRVEGNIPEHAILKSSNPSLNITRESNSNYTVITESRGVDTLALYLNDSIIWKEFFYRKSVHISLTIGDITTNECTISEILETPVLKFFDKECRCNTFPDIELLSYKIGFFDKEKKETYYHKTKACLKLSEEIIEKIKELKVGDVFVIVDIFVSTNNYGSRKLVPVYFEIIE